MIERSMIHPGGTQQGTRSAKRNAVLYLSGLAASTIGDTAMSLVAGIWVKTLTGSNAAAGLVTALVYAPTLAAPAAGLLADRVRRRPLLVWVNLAMTLVLPTLLLVDRADRIWLIYLVMAAYGTALALSDPAENALFTVMFDQDFRARLNGIRMSIQEVGRLLAPLAGAGLFVALGGGAVALLDAATFALAAILITTLRVSEPRAEPPARPWRAELLAGAAHLWRTRDLRTLLLVAMSAMLASGVAFPAQYAMLDALHREPGFLAVFSAVLGFGSLLAGLTSGRLITRFGEARVAVAGLAKQHHRLHIAVPALAAGRTRRRLRTRLRTALDRRRRLHPDAATHPLELQGRAAATVGLLLFGAQPLAQLAGAGLIDIIDYRALYAAAALTGLLAAAVQARAARTPPR